MADIDSLQVRISASSKQAQNAITDLTNKLSDLASALNDTDPSSGKYASGLSNLTDYFDTLGNAVKIVDAKKIKEVAQAMNMLNKAASGFGSKNNQPDFTKTGKSIANASSQAKDLAKNLAKSYNIKNKDAIAEMADSFDNFFKSLDGGDSEAADRYLGNISRIVKEYAKIPNIVDETDKELANANINFGKDAKEFFNRDTDAMKRFRGKQGFANTKNYGTQGVGQEPVQAVREITGQEPASNEEAMQMIKDAQERSKAVLSFNEAVKAGLADTEALDHEIEDLADSMISASANSDKAAASLENFGKQVQVPSGFEGFDYFGDEDTFGNFANTVSQVGDAASKATPSLNDFVNSVNNVDSSDEEVNFNDDALSMQNMATNAETASSSLNNFAQVAQATANATQNIAPVTAQEGITSMAESLRSLEGIHIPDFTNLTTLASAMRSLGSSSAVTAGQNLSSLSSGLSQLSGIHVDFGGVDFEQLNSMIDAIRRLGSKAAVTAGTNLKDLGANLNSLGNINIPDGIADKLVALASAIARFGYSSAAKAPNNIREMAKAFAGLISSLQGAGTVDQSVIDLANAMSQLASNGQKISSASKGLSSFISAGKSGGSSFGWLDGIKGKISSFKGLPSIFGSARKATFSLASAFGSLYANFFLVIRGINLVKKAIGYASDLTEVQNVVDTAFGQMSNKVEDFANTSISQLGMSELAAKKFASQYQAMGSAMGIAGSEVAKASELVDQNLGQNATNYIKNADSMADMSINLTRLAGDMASFYNVEQDVVAEDLQAVFTGQTRPLRQYGLDLTQATLQEWALKHGIDANVQSMTNAEKTLLRYQYVMSNTTNAQGDFMKTMDTWANVIRTIQMQFQQLGAIIGGAFINAFKPIAVSFRNVMNTVIKLAEKTVNALGKIFGWQIEIQEVGIANDMEGAAAGADDTAKGLGDANKKAKELKRTILGFDELNVLQDNKDKNGSGSGGGGGATGGGAGGGANGGTVSIMKTKPYESDIDNLFDLGRRISDTLAKAMEGINWDKIYDKASGFGTGLANFLNGLITPRTFGDLGATIAGAINTALHFLDRFGENFDFYNFGQSVKEGIRQCLGNIDWETAFSAANNWGTGLADYLNGLIDPDTFGLVGETVANALNTALEFLDSFGERFSWKNFGASLAEGLNKFFRTFKWSKLGRTLKVWANGLLDAIIEFIDKTDWDKIGQSIGEFLEALDFLDTGKKVGQAIWKAINAGLELFKNSFKTAPLETALLSLVGLTKLLDTKPLQMFGTALGGAYDNAVKFFDQIQKGNGVLSGLVALFPGLQQPVNGLQEALVQYNLGLAEGVPKTEALGVAFNTFRDSLNPVQQGILGVTGGLVEFVGTQSGVQGIIETIHSGTGEVTDFITEIGKIAGSVATGTAALTIAFGVPAGPIAAAVIAVTGLIKGVNDALENIKAEAVGTAIHDALTNPGGVTIDEIASHFGDQIGKITTDLDTTKTKLQSISEAKVDVDNTTSSIQQLEAGISSGAYTAEEKVPDIIEQFNTLLTQTQSIFDQEYEVITGNMAGAWADLLKAQGEAVPTMIADLASYRDQANQSLGDAKSQFDALVTSYNNGEISADEFNQKAQPLIDTLTSVNNDKINETATAVTDFGKSLDLSDYLTDDKLDTAKFTSAIDTITTKAQQGQKDAETIYQEGKTNIDDYKRQLDQLGIDTSGFDWSALYGANEDQKTTTLTSIQTAYTEFGNTLQTKVLDEIPGVIQKAEEQYENMSPFEKMFTTKGEVVSQALSDYKTNIVDPLTEGLQTQYGKLDIDVAPYASDATKRIIASMYDDEASTYANGEATNWAGDLKGSWETALDTATTDVLDTAKTKGGDIATGMGQGLVDNSDDAAHTGISAFFDKVKSWFASVFDSHSPARAMYPMGKNIILGVVEGFKTGFGDFNTAVGDFFKNTVEPLFSADKWGKIGDGIQGGFETLCSGLKTLFDGSKETVETDMGAIDDSVTTKMSDASTQNAKNLQTMFTDTNTNMANMSQITEDNMSASNKSVTDKMDDSASKLKTDVEAMKTDVDTNFGSINDTTTDKFGAAGKTISDTIADASKNVTDGVGGMEGVFKNAKFEFPKIKLPHFKLEGEFSLKDKKVPHLSVDWYANGGFPEDGLFMANHGELVGQFSNGRTAVANNEQITEGIAVAVERSIETTLPSILQRYVSHGDTVIRLGDEDIARAASRGQRSIDKRYNPSIQIG